MDSRRSENPRAFMPGSVKTLHAEPEPVTANDGWEGFLHWLASMSQLDLFAYKLPQLERRIAIRRQMSGFSNWTDYRYFLEANPQACTRLQESLTISVSSFFRDPEQWDILEEQYLHPGKGPLRAWSAGCASGQELYTLAICLERYSRLPGSTLLGTDCNREVVAQALSGQYKFLQPGEALPAAVLPYVEIDKRTYAVTGYLRSHVQFGCADLFRQSFSDRWDMILCRNLLIYLNHDAQARLVRRFCQVLQPGGILFIGRSERLFQPESLGLKRLSLCIYQKTDLCAGLRS